MLKKSLIAVFMITLFQTTTLTGLVIEDDIKLALMLLVSHWYENREPVSSDSVNTIPFGFTILKQHRKIPDVGGLMQAGRLRHRVTIRTSQPPERLRSAG
jgi:hypothetical protein